MLHCGLVGMRNYTRRLVKLCERGRKDGWWYSRLRQNALRIRARRQAVFFDQVSRSMEKLVPYARNARVTLGLETRFGIEEIPSEEETATLMERFGSGPIAYWHDVGHALVKEELGLLETESILERFRGRTAGMHLQDFNPPAEDHLPPGKGCFDFNRLGPYLEDEMILAWEIHPRWRAEQISGAVSRIHRDLSTAGCA